MGVKKSLFTFRKKKGVKHPVLIVGANRTKFKSMGLTHSSGNYKKNKKGKRNNFRLKVNPNPNDKRDSYLRKQVIEDFKFKFSKAFNNYHLSNEDIDELKKFLDKKKR